MHLAYMPTKLLLSAALLSGLCASPLFGQLSIEPPPTPQTMPSDRSILPTSTMPATAPAESPIPSAEKVFEQLLRDRETANAAATAPGAASRPSGPSTPGLLPEGEPIIGRSGRLQKDPQTGALTLVFDAKPGAASYKPMPVLPTRTLAAMEDASDFGARPITFPIVAETTQYRGKNYLLLKPGDPIRPNADAGPATSQPAPATRPEFGPQVQPTAPDAPPAVPFREGDIISNRVGRLIRDPRTGTVLFEFAADGKGMTDPPLGVLPSKYLAVMENASQHGAKSVKFRVSGEITLYRGRNFLYLHFVQAIRDLNQGLGG